MANFVEGIVTAAPQTAGDGGIGAHDPFTVSEGNLILDIPRAEDVTDVAAACQDPEIQRFTSVPIPYELRNAEHFVTEVTANLWKNGGANWSVRLRDDRGQHFVATIGIRNAQGGNAEIGFWTSPEWRGQGIMTRAVRLAVRTAFNKLGFGAVTWYANPENLASRKVAWKCGFSFGGVMRGLWRGRENREDLVMASVLKDDPMEPRGTWEDAEMIGMRPNPRDPEALVRQFHETYHLPVVTSGPDLDNERMHMRLSLILEETSELVRALYGPKAYATIQAAIAELRSADEHERDLIEVADALADLTYVVYGMALEAGISLPAVLKEVQASNMSKLGEDGKPIYREDGKVLKGPGFFNPNIKRALDTKIASSRYDVEVKS